MAPRPGGHDIRHQATRYPTMPLPDEKTAKILVVDDEPANLKLLVRMLGSADYQNVQGTNDPYEALRLITSETDLLILDLNMPGMNGFEVMAEIQHRQLDPEPPILILTAQASQEYRIKGLQNGARDYLTKPFDRLELLARVSNLAQNSLYQRQLRQQNIQLEERVKERTQELEMTRLQVIQQLGRAAEFRDNETGMHIIRMSKMAQSLGEAAGLSAGDCQLLLNASPMHDLGKIGIPDHILLKPGKLDPDEWDTMQTHTTIGASILATGDSHLMRTARDIALCHHERWDGTGYPHGLAGEDIPLLARITTIADVFDALTSERPYKKAWPVQDACRLILDNSGSQFDPALAACFEKIVPIFVDIRANHPDNGH